MGRKQEETWRDRAGTSTGPGGWEGSGAAHPEPCAASAAALLLLPGPARRGALQPDAELHPQAGFLQDPPLPREHG